jgi:hypothetical protein
MSTNNFSGRKSHAKENIILSRLATKTINTIARLCGYLQRNNGKISPKNLIIGFMIMVSKQRNTYTDWATEIGLLTGNTVSKQALEERRAILRHANQFLIMKDCFGSYATSQ